MAYVEAWVGFARHYPEAILAGADAGDPPSAPAEATEIPVYAVTVVVWAARAALAAPCSGVRVLLGFGECDGFAFQALDATKAFLSREGAEVERVVLAWTRAVVSLLPGEGGSVTGGVRSTCEAGETGAEAVLAAGIEGGKALEGAAGEGVWRLVGFAPPALVRDELAPLVPVPDLPCEGPPGA